MEARRRRGAHRQPPRDRPPDVGDAEAIVFHRSFALGRFVRSLPAQGVDARLLVNGELRAIAHSTNELAERICVVARLLGATGEHLLAGDRIITWSIVQVPVRPGDDMVADLGPLGTVRLVSPRRETLKPCREALQQQPAEFPPPFSYSQRRTPRRFDEGSHR